MLVLSRKCNESVVIQAPPEGIPAGTIIRVTVCEVRGDKARLGFEAPTAIPIHRNEVFAAIQAENSGT